MANLIGVSRQTINAMEKNKYVSSTVLSLKIAKVFGENVEEAKKSKSQLPDAIKFPGGGKYADGAENVCKYQIAKGTRVQTLIR